MRNHWLLVVDLALALLLSSFPHSTLALAVNRKNPVETLLDNVMNRGDTAKTPPQMDRGEALLKVLDIQSNTEPKPFNVPLQQLPALITASMPVRSRRPRLALFCHVTARY